MKPKKDFDAVELMRQARNDLSKKYLNNPELERKELNEINSKYGIKTNKQTGSGNKGTKIKG